CAHAGAPRIDRFRRPNRRSVLRRLGTAGPGGRRHYRHRLRRLDLRSGDPRDRREALTRMATGNASEGPWQVPGLRTRRVLGIPFAMVDYDQAMDVMDTMVSDRVKGYVCAIAVHCV